LATGTASLPQAIKTAVDRLVKPMTRHTNWVLLGCGAAAIVAGAALIVSDYTLPAIACVVVGIIFVVFS
jgi:hypothetical protein